MNILDHLRRKRGFVLGKVVKRMRLKGFGFGRVRWHWKRVMLEKLYFQGSGMNNHVIITGGSGSGKSNACKLLLHALAGKGVNFVVFDPHNEYAAMAYDLGANAYDASITRFNIFDLDGMTKAEKISDLTETFKRIFRLGELQSYELYKCLGFLYGGYLSGLPSMNALLHVISIFKKNAKGNELNILNGLEKRFRMLDDGANAKGIEAGMLTDSRSIMALSSLHSSESQVVYMESLLRKVYSMMLSGAIMKPFYIVIDEAEKLSNSRIVARLVEEGRKYGIGIIAVSQRAKALDRSIISNSALHIAFYQREPEELNYVANLIAGGNEMERFTEVKRAIRNLRRGEAMVQFQYREPMVAELKLCKIAKEYIGIRLLEAAKSPIEKSALFHAVNAASSEEVSEGIKELILRGLLRYHVISNGTFAGVWYITTPLYSAEHEVYVWLLSRLLSDNKINNYIYDRANGPDIRAYANGARIAIEYETGKNAMDAAARMIEKRRTKFDRVIVVVNDAHFERYAKTLSVVQVLRASEALEGGLAKLASGSSGKT